MRCVYIFQKGWEEDTVNYFDLTVNTQFPLLEYSTQFKRHV